MVGTAHMFPIWAESRVHRGLCGHLWGRSRCGGLSKTTVSPEVALGGALSPDLCALHRPTHFKPRLLHLASTCPPPGFT